MLFSRYKIETIWSNTVFLLISISSSSWYTVHFSVHESIYTAGIESFNSENLKNVETKEKTVLPAPEDIKTEKTIQGILQGVESFESDTLKTVKTREPASATAMIQVYLLSIVFESVRQESSVSFCTLLYCTASFGLFKGTRTHA